MQRHSTGLLAAATSRTLAGAGVSTAFGLGAEGDRSRLQPTAASRVANAKNLLSVFGTAWTAKGFEIVVLELAAAPGWLSARGVRVPFTRVHTADHDNAILSDGSVRPPDGLRPV